MNNLRDLFLLRPEVVFLNHGSFGACPRPVFETYQAWQLELERQPLEFLGRRFGALMQDARDRLGQFLGTDKENLLFVPNATTGLNIVARSLKLNPSDEILTTDHEYGALDRTWEFICQKRKARYKRQPVPLPVASTEQVVEAIWSGVTDRTRVLFLSHITSITALILPIEELIRRARDSEILTVIDGAHAPGQVHLNLDALGVDFYAGNCHKWLMAPKGSAFLYVRPEMQGLVEPLVVSWDDKSLARARFIQENEFQGTRDIAAYLSVPAAIDFMQEYNWPEVQRKCHELVRYARNQFCEISGEPPISPASDTWIRQMVAHPLPPCDGELLQKRLYDKFKVEIPIMELNGRQYIRISVQGYNSLPDVDTMIDALRVSLAELQKDEKNRTR